MAKSTAERIKNFIRRLRGKITKNEESQPQQPYPLPPVPNPVPQPAPVTPVQPPLPPVPNPVAPSTTPTPISETIDFEKAKQLALQQSGAKYVYDERGLLIKPPGVQLRGFKVDPIIEADCPTGVRVHTGHILSKARPDLGETFMGYCMRVVLQCGKDQIALDGIGAMFLGSEGVFKYFGGWKADGSNWPEGATTWYNGPPRTEVEKEEEARRAKQAEEQWAEHWRQKEEARKREREQQAPPTQPTKPPTEGEEEIPISQG